MSDASHSTIRSHRDLIVWQKAMALVTNVYGLTKAFPRDEIYGLQARHAERLLPSQLT